MPTRILRDGILSSRHVAALSDSAEILYRRLMSVVDDYGRTEADIDLIRVRCFPLQLDAWKNPRILKALAELSGSPLVTVYHGGGKQLLQVNNFGQRVQSKPKYPGPEDDIDSKGLPLTTVENGGKPSPAVQSESESESESKTYLADSGKSESAPKPKTIQSWFDSEFWPTWPVSENKAAALKAAQKLDRSEFPAIIAGVKAQAARIAGMDRPIHAATWLNNRRWEDETVPSLFAVSAPLPKVEPIVDRLKLEYEAHVRAGGEA